MDELADLRATIAVLNKALATTSESNARLLERVNELESVIQSHGIPVKTYTGNVAHYCRGNDGRLPDHG